MTKPTIPDRLYFKIGEVAKLADVPTHVLRYWESEFPPIRPKRANSKQRLYRKEDVELILTIKVLLHEQGYTIAGARRLIETGDVQDTITRSQETKSNAPVDRLQMIKKELKDIQQLLNDEKEE